MANGNTHSQPTTDPFGRPVRNPEMAARMPLVNPVGQDYGGRLIGYGGRMGLEGRNQSNLFDPTQFMDQNDAMMARYQALLGQQDPLAMAYQQEQLARGGGLADAAGGVFGGVQDQARLVGGLSPLALNAANQQAAGINQQAGMLAGMSPQALQAANQAAAQMSQYGNQVGQYGPQAVQAAQQAAAGMRGQAGDLRGFTDPAAAALGRFGAEQTGLYGSSFMPIEQQIADYARNYDTAERRAGEAGRARADVTSEFGRQRQANERRLASMGIDPSMGAGRSLQLDMAEAAARAGAAENARRQIEQQGVALRGQAANIGAGIAGRGAAATQAGANLGAQGAQGAANILQGAGGMEQAGLNLGANIGSQAANIAQGAGAMRQQGYGTAGNLAQGAGSLYNQAGGLQQQGIQNAGNLGIGAGGLSLDALRGYGSGLATGTNIQAEGLGARESILPYLSGMQGGIDRNVGIASDWNRGIWNTQGNRQGSPSGWGAAGSALLGAAGNLAGTWLGTRTPVPADSGRGQRADGGFLYSTRQRFADGGGMLPAGRVLSFPMNAPVQPVVGRADGGFTVEKGCQLIGNQPRMPDGRACQVKVLGAMEAADGGQFIHTLRALPPTEHPQGQGVLMPRGQMADGTQPPGVVVGPSDGTGVDDQVPAMLSAEEYVVPADVVRKKGTEFFDKLLEKYHVPAAVQREQMGVQ